MGAPPPPPPPPMRGRGPSGRALGPPPTPPPGPRPPGGRPPPPPPPPRSSRALGPPPPPPPLLCIFPSAKKRASLKPLYWVKVTRALQGSLWDELRRLGEAQTAPEFDVSEIETLFSATVQKPPAKPINDQLINIGRAIHSEFLLILAKMSLPDLMATFLAMDESLLDIDLIENFIKCVPTNEEMRLLQNYTGDTATLGTCEQYFLKLMKVPRIETKLGVFYFKIQFSTQIIEFKKRLNAVNTVCEELGTSQKLKEVMAMVSYVLTLNQGSTRGPALGFNLDSLLKLSDLRAANSKMTLMHYLCEVLASKASHLLDFQKDLESLESASKIQWNSLAEEMETIVKGLENMKQELIASKSDGPVSQVFRKTLKDFISTAEIEVGTVSTLYAVLGENADAVVYYFGEHPKRGTFEQVTATLLKFIRLFKKALDQSANQAELELGVSSGSRRKWVRPIFENVPLVTDVWRAIYAEIMLMRVKMSLPDIMAAVLAMDESVLDVDQIENLIKCCPTKEEMRLLKNYTSDTEALGKCEQYFLEGMKVPRVESKLRVFSFKIQFDSQIAEFKKSLNVVNSVCEELRTSQKLKEIMKKILCLGNTLNQGTMRGAAVGFKLESLLKLGDTRAANSKMTLMHYLCKVVASKASHLLNFHKDLESLELASKLQLRSLAEEMQALTKGLEKVKQELTASESDGPVSEVFHKTLKDFITIAETEMATVSSLYSVVGRNADGLVHYFGEDPKCYPFEEVTATLVHFVRLFKKAHEENVKQAELEKRKATKEAERRRPKESISQRKEQLIIADPDT